MNSQNTSAIDARLDNLHQARERTLCQPSGTTRSLQLAKLADAEAELWEQLADRTRSRVHWRAAQAAREHALGMARAWRRRAAQQRARASTPAFGTAA